MLSQSQRVVCLRQPDLDLDARTVRQVEHGVGNMIAMSTPTASIQRPISVMSRCGVGGRSRSCASDSGDATADLLVEPLSDVMPPREALGTWPRGAAPDPGCTPRSPESFVS